MLSRVSALRTVILGLSVATASHSIMAATPAPAQEQSQPQAYDISPGSLDRVLGTFGQQAGVMIGIDSALAAGIQSKGLKGSFSVDEALERLLGPVNLQAERESGGYRVVAKPVSQDGKMELQTTQVNANQLGTVTEGTGSYTPGTIATGNPAINLGGDPPGHG